MTYIELQDKLHRLIYKAAWDRENFTEQEKQEVLRLQEEQKEYPEWFEHEARKQWYKRHRKVGLV